MSSNGTHTGGDEAGAGVGDIKKRTSPRDNEVEQQALPLLWLLRAKVTIPPRATRYLDRRGLVEQAMPTSHRVVLVRAPGGFGKTTLLAECCRRLAAQGVTTAWLSVDEQDSVEILDTYLAFAFHHAGLNAIDALDTEDAAIAPFDHRVGLLMRAIEEHGEPCVLVLDELERLSDPESVALINLLLDRSPENFHLALVCRQLPDGINLAVPVLEGAASVLTVDQLRFSKAEIARFFGGGLSRRQLASLVSESAGWPIALQIYGNQQGSGGLETTLAVSEVVDNWVESRLWSGLSEADRDQLLDLGLFEWTDRSLLDEVFGSLGVLDRMRSLPTLAGLLEPLRMGASEAWRLHPLIGGYCTRRRRRQTPDRFRTIHRRIATALSGRGDTVSAMRHAAQAQDPVLMGDILALTGGVRLWAREGLVLLQSVDRYLTGEVFAARPRLALARCLVMIMTGRLEEARRLYAATEVQTEGFNGDQTNEDLDLQVDRCHIEGLLFIYGGEPLGSNAFQAWYRDAAQLADNLAVEPLMRGSFENGLCIVHHHRAEFDSATHRAERALRWLGEESPYLSALVDLQLGQMAMAQGRLEEAQTCYARARRGAKTQYMRDPELATITDVLTKELDLERDLLGDAPERPVRIPKALMRSGTPFAAFAAASGVVAELTLVSSGVDAALLALAGMQEFTRRSRLRSLGRALSAQRIGLLAQAGRVDEARRLWRIDGLPGDADACLSLLDQSWREMEAIACARLRLLTVGEKFEEGRSFLNRLTGLCEERGLRRTWMRAISLGIELEHRADNPTAAVALLAEFLQLFEDTRYVRPLVREREAARTALRRFLATARDSKAKTHAQRLFSELAADEPENGAPRFSSREIQVLQQLATHRDREIAAALGVSVDGVRYHIKNIFAKTGARDRFEAVRRARSKGIRLPE